ncbi:MAG: DNA polymerase I [Thermomicrobiales bacterium]
MSAETSTNGSHPRLVLVDGHGLAFRAFYAVPPSLATSSGELTNATFGFTSMLLDVLAAHEPDYILVSFDVGLTFRHEQFEDYKAHRKPMPDELKPQIDRMKQVLEALNIPIYVAEGFEADDVIGTLSRQAAEKGIEAFIVTGDSDMLQLVDDHVVVVLPGAQRFGEYRIFDRDAVRERYGFGPERVIDYKALVGDKSDNIPGVAGIGDKSAKQLIAQFESIDDMYERLDEIKQARSRNAMEKDRDAAFQSRELVTIVRDVPIDLDLERCAVHDYDRSAAVGIFQELEFRTLLGKLPGDAADVAAVADSVSTPLTDGIAVVSEEELSDLAAEIAEAPMLAVDVETDGLDPQRCNLVGIAIATASDAGYYIPLKHVESALADPDDVDRIIRPAIEQHPNIIAHNAKFDLAVLQRHGYDKMTIAGDTMLSAYVLGENSLGLKELAFNRLGLQMTPITDLIGTGRKQITMDQVPAAKATPYASADVEATMRLEPLLTADVRERDQEKLLDTIEIPLIPVLARMERAGIALDVEMLEELSDQLEAQIGEIQSDIYGAVGHEFNLNSPKQLADVLFEEIGLPPGRRTKTGYSVAQNVLEGLSGAHDAVDLVLEYRQLAKLKSTYVDALPNQVNPDTGRIHTNFNQTIAATGRLSSTDPNLQNIPVRTDLGRQVRRAFIADNRNGRAIFDEESILFGADYSQMELRLMAHYSQDEALVDAFKHGQDIHAATAAEVFGVPLDEVTADQRATAKVVNFGIMYGMQPWGLARDTGMSQGDARDFISRYKERFSGVDHFIEETIQSTERDGYASTLYGRRRYLPDILTSGPARQAAERAAINLPIQGSAADIMKLAMLDVDRKLAELGLRSLMLLQVHDELIFEAPISELDQLRDLVVESMMGVAQLSVPLEVEPKAGPNWEEMNPL